MFNRFASKVATGSAVSIITGITFWDEQRRLNEWKKNNGSNNYEMKSQSISGIGCYYYPIKKDSVVKILHGK